MRKLVGTWILLSAAFAVGRAALWLGTSTVDLRFPGLFELVAVPLAQVLALLWDALLERRKPVVALRSTTG